MGGFSRVPGPGPARRHTHSGLAAALAFLGSDSCGMDLSKCLWRQTITYAMARCDRMQWTFLVEQGRVVDVVYPAVPKMEFGLERETAGHCVTPRSRNPAVGRVAYELIVDGSRSGGRDG